MGLSAGPSRLGYRPPRGAANDASDWIVTDNMLAYLIKRADKLAAFADNPTA